MRSRHLFLIGLTATLAGTPAVAQETRNTPRDVVQELPLKTLRGPLATLYSKGFKDVAEEHQATFSGFIGHYDAVLAQGFQLTVAVLSREDWAALDASRPYGTPFVTDFGPQPVLVMPVDATAAALDKAMHEVGHALASQFLYPTPRPAEPSVKWFDEWLAVFFVRGYELATGRATPGTGFTGEGPVPTWRSLAHYDAHRDAIDADPSSAQFAWYRSAFEAQADVVYAKHGLTWLESMRQSLPWDSYADWTPHALLQVLASPDPSWILWSRKVDGPPPAPVIALTESGPDDAVVEEIADADDP